MLPHLIVAQSGEDLGILLNTSAGPLVYSASVGGPLSTAAPSFYIYYDGKGCTGNAGIPQMQFGQSSNPVNLAFNTIFHGTIFQLTGAATANFQAQSVEDTVGGGGACNNIVQPPMLVDVFNAKDTTIPDKQFKLNDTRIDLK